MEPHTYCNYCGAAFGHTKWPRVCVTCDRVTWRNPLPVAILLVKCEGGLLLVQRNIEPARGQWALPGGYVDYGESWQEAAVRELREETGAICSPHHTRLVDVRNSNSHGSTMLLFGVTTIEVELPDFKPNEETQAIVVAHEPRDLCFPIHSEMCRWFFHNKSNHWLV